MKPITTAVLAAVSLFAAVPAGQAQPYYHHRGAGERIVENLVDHATGWDLDRRINWMQDRINHGRDDGSLDRREAHHAQNELDNIRADKARFERRHRGRLDDYARSDLESRLDRLNDQLHWLRHNDERRPW